MSSVLERMERQAVVLERKRMMNDIENDLDLQWLKEYEELRWRDKTRALRYSGDPIASFVTGTSVELLYANTASGAAKNTFSTEATPILNDEASMGQQAKFGAGYFLAGRVGQTVRIIARGICSTTGTPTYQFLIRLGATGTGGTLVWEAPAATTLSAISNKGWEIAADLILRTNATVGANSTIQGIGLFTGDASGFNANSLGLMGWANNSQPGTIATFNAAVDNFVNVNVVCSASSSSNSVQLLQLLVYGLN